MFKFLPKCTKLNITQLGFADNLLLFCRGDMPFVEKLFECLTNFSRVSRLVAYVDKNSIILLVLIWMFIMLSLIDSDSPMATSLLGT